MNPAQFGVAFKYFSKASASLKSIKSKLSPYGPKSSYLSGASEEPQAAIDLPQKFPKILRLDKKINIYFYRYKIRL